MKRKLSSKNNKNLDSAIEQIEKYIRNLRPKTYTDIKLATKTISKAAIGAHLSVHSVTETLEFINELAHMMVNDISEHLEIPLDHANKIH